MNALLLVFELFAAVAYLSNRWCRAPVPVFAGAAYGATVFLAAHEIAVPALQLSSNLEQEVERVDLVSRS